MSPVSDFVAGGVGPSNIFGDGSDGGVVITGTTTETRNRYWNTLFLDAGGVYVGANWLVHARISAIINGTHHNDGGAGAAAGTAGAVTASGYLNGSLGTGGAGGVAAGSAGASLGQCVGGSGGAGGAGSGGAGGAAGVATALLALEGGPMPRSLALLQGMTFGKGGVVAYRAGMGGGGGGGDATAGAGGGAGAGFLWLATPNLIMGATGIIRAGGGAGGSAIAGNRGGGGGGGGGAAIVIAAKRQLDPAAIVAAPGGAAGAGFGTGVAGNAGNDGKVVLLQTSREDG